MTRRKQGVCVLESCNNEERVYTLCKSCRDTHKVYVYRDLERRRAEARRRAAEARKRELSAEEAARVEERRRLAEENDRGKVDPIPVPKSKLGVHRTNRPLEAYMITALQQALLVESSREVGEDIGLAHQTVRRLAACSPGSPVGERTYDLLREWMGIA